MNAAIVMDYVKKRMIELGHAENYSIYLRHYIIEAAGTITFDAPNEMWVLIEPVEMLYILSQNGLYDISVTYNNEVQYEHTGRIEMKNYTGDRAIHARFIQVIPTK